MRTICGIVLLDWETERATSLRTILFLKTAAAAFMMTLDATPESMTEKASFISLRLLLCKSAI
jgi:hypothetical protein